MHVREGEGRRTQSKKFTGDLNLPNLIKIIYQLTLTTHQPIAANPSVGTWPKTIEVHEALNIKSLISIETVCLQA